MTWRRFKVLFMKIFSWQDPEEERRIADSVDWSSAQHKPVSELSKKPAVDLSQYVHQVRVGRDE